MTPPDLEGLCARCWQRAGLCLCAAIPTVDTGVELVVLRHAKESWRTSNTARLASLALPKLSVVEIGRVPDDVPPPEALTAPMNRDPRALEAFWAERDRTNAEIAALIGAGAAREDTWLLFPTARPGVFPSAERPKRLIVPDGSWRQARRIIQRIPGLDALPRLSLPTAEPRRRLRRPPLAEGMSTLEAIARALELLEGEHAAEPLLALYDRLVEQHFTVRRRNERPAG